MNEARLARIEDALARIERELGSIIREKCKCGGWASNGGNSWTKSGALCPIHNDDTPFKGRAHGRDRDPD